MKISENDLFKHYNLYAAIGLLNTIFQIARMCKFSRREFPLNITSVLVIGSLAFADPFCRVLDRLLKYLITYNL